MFVTEPIRVSSKTFSIWSCAPWMMMQPRSPKPCATSHSARIPVLSMKVTFEKIDRDRPSRLHVGLKGGRDPFRRRQVDLS